MIITTFLIALTALSIHTGVVVDNPATSGECDENTMTCLACHNGSTGKQDHFTIGQPTGNPQAPHPVCVQYPLYKQEYRAMDTLPAAITIVENKIGCLSCHKKEVPTELAVEDHGSRLCFACHDK